MQTYAIMYDLGRDMDESSATDDSEEDGDNDDDNEDEEGMAGSLGDIIKPSLLKKSGSESPDQEKPEEPIGTHCGNFMIFQSLRFYVKSNQTSQSWGF